MKYIWWFIVIIIYLITLLTYALIDHLLVNKEDKLTSGDAIFFGVASVITISLIPLIR